MNRMFITGKLVRLANIHDMALKKLFNLRELFSLSCAESSSGEKSIRAPGSSGSCNGCRTPDLLRPSAFPRVGPV